MTKRFFAGGNTVRGFFSYFDNILPTKKANRLFLLKGGPGTGKSSLMKDIMARIEDFDYSLELCQCSSDKNSLDGVLIKDKSVLIVDATAPHAMDQKIPGIADEIANLGAFIDDGILSKYKKEIITINDEKSDSYSTAYHYLSCLDGIAKSTEAINAKYFTKRDAINVAKSIIKSIDITPPQRVGTERKLFLSAITADGIINHVETLAELAGKTIVLSTSTNINTGDVISRIAEHLIENGFDIETYYSAFAPESAIEHLYVEELGLFVTTKNKYIDYNYLKNDWIINLDTGIMDKVDIETLEDNFELTDSILKKAIKSLNRARDLHANLEKFYIESMDFTHMDDIAISIVGKINSF